MAAQDWEGEASLFWVGGEGGTGGRGAGPSAGSRTPILGRPVAGCSVRLFWETGSLSEKNKTGSLFYTTFLKSPGTSLVVQWLRICLPGEGTRVLALVREDSTCRKATMPVCATTSEPVL